MTPAIAVAPEPPPPEIVMVGTLLARYPEPPSFSDTVCTTPDNTVATALACVPFASLGALIVTVGTLVKPEPPLVTAMIPTEPTLTTLLPSHE